MTSNRLPPIAMAFVMLLAAATGAVALTVDTETTTTTSTSDLTGTSVIEQPHNSSKVQNIEIAGDSNTNTSTLANPGTEMQLEFVVNDTKHSQDGQVLYSTDENWTQTAVSAAPDHYNLTVSNNKFGDALEYGADENVTVDARITFNASETDESTLNITFTVAPNGSDARVAFDSSERQTQSNGTFFGLSTSSIPFVGGGVGAAEVSDNVSVTNKTSTITLSVSNQTAVDAFSEVASSGSAGDLSTIGYVEANGQMVPVFVESADASWLDSDEAYATVASDGTEVVIHNANSTFDSSTSSIDVTATGNDALGFWETRSMLSSYGASTTKQLTTAAGAVDANGDPFEDS